MEFTIKNCRVEITFLFLATLTFSLLCDRTGMAGIGLIATILHESGHVFVMNLFGIPPKRIRMNPFGIDIVEGDRICSRRLTDALIALAGPISNLLFFGLFSVVCFFWYQKYFFFLAAANLGLFVFNILPIEPLDGGQALYSVLCLRISSEQAERITQIISFMALFPLALAGFIALFRSRYNFSLLLATVYLMILLLTKKGRYF